MPLSSKQKTALALRIAVARFLDDFAAPAGIDAQTNSLNQARARLSVWIASAVTVETDEAIRVHLTDAAADLATWLAGHASYPNDRIEAAINAIRLTAAEVQQGDGDGPARQQADGSYPCRCGFMTVARLVEDHALASYLSAANSTEYWPEIFYETQLTPDDLKQLGAFKISGGASISGPTRTVTLVIKDDVLSAADLCQVVYVLFHEIVCHGFQDAVQLDQVKNCKPQCHWTEGWMDAVAYRMAVRSARDGGSALEWLPLNGPDAEAAMMEVHSARYKDPVGLKTNDAKLRRAARKALSELQIAFRETGMAKSEADAEELAHQFSMLANATAGSRILIDLSDRLQGVLLSKERKKERVYAASACLQFLEHRQISRLLCDLKTL